MTGSEIFDKTVNKKISIHASASKVWEALTNPEVMKLWMLDTEINVISDWKVGSEIVIKESLDWIDFENTGTILRLVPQKVFEYNYWSTLSGKPANADKYSVVTFELNEEDNVTTLSFTQSNFMEETEYRHSNFYWNTALEILRGVVENNGDW